MAALGAVGCGTPALGGGAAFPMAALAIPRRGFADPLNVLETNLNGVYFMSSEAIQNRGR